MAGLPGGQVGLNEMQPGLGRELADLASDVQSAVAPAAAAPGLRAQYVRPGAGAPASAGLGQAAGGGRSEP